MSRAYYNEIDPYAAQWLRNLIQAGHIPAGDVDTRSIEDVRPSDLDGYTQCHFFAGIGGWAYAARLAGIPDDESIWTGSCPCQPFSQAGKGSGFADERHLWPTWFHLISQCKPARIFGEQVAAPLINPWIDLVQDDLEAMGYAFGAVPFPAAGVGAPHIRDRLYWVADANLSKSEQPKRKRAVSAQAQGSRAFGESNGCGDAVRLADTKSGGSWTGLCDSQSGEIGRHQLANCGSVIGLANYARSRRREECADAGWRTEGNGEKRVSAGPGASGGDMQPGPVNGFWRNADWLHCRDGKWRPVEPGTFPLVAGLPEYLDRLRAIEMAGWQEIVRYGKQNKANPDEVLRMVQEAVRAQASREEFVIGMLQQFHAPSLLLDYLLCVAAARNGAADGSGGAKASTEAQYRIVRGVRDGGGHGGSSHKRRPEKQQPVKPSDSLLSLSLVLARHAEAYWKESRSAHAASGRAPMLKGFGNAIVPQEAAEFIKAARATA